MTYARSSILIILAMAATAGEAFTVSTDKVTYRPGERIAITVGGAGPGELTVELVSAIERTRELYAGVPAGGAWTGTVACDGLRWGAEIRARSGGMTQRAVFGVSGDVWELAQMSAYLSRELLACEDPVVAKQAADQLRAEGFTGYEAFFWAPCDMFDFNPGEGRFTSSQSAYPASGKGTRNANRALQAQGMHPTVYANLWGGGGPPGFEYARRHPLSVAGFNVACSVLEDYPLVDSGHLRPRGLQWCFTNLSLVAPPEVYLDHAAQLIASSRSFGWEAVRYDSYYTVPVIRRATALVRARLAAEVPDFQMGYNTNVMDDLANGSLPVMVSGGGLAMTEEVRIEGQGNDLVRYGNAIADRRDAVQAFGGHLGSIYARADREPDNALLSGVFLAVGTHPYYSGLDRNAGQHPRFALRYAEYLWDNRLRPLAQPEAVVSFPGGKPTSLWQRVTRTRTLAGDERRLVMNLLNIPEGFRYKQAKNPPLQPLTDLPVRLVLPPGAQVRSCWLLDCAPDIRERKLTPRNEGGAVVVIVPEVGTWAVLCLDFASRQPLATAPDPKAIGDSILQDWLLCGPFPSDDKLSGHDQPFGPERGPLDAKARYAGGKAGEVGWTPWRAPGDPLQGLVQIEMGRIAGGDERRDGSFYGNAPYSTGYAWTRVVSDRERDLEMRASGDDRLRVWVNGAVTIEGTGITDRKLVIDQLRAPVHLRKGPNDILVKLTNRWLDWEFILRLCEKDGAPATGLDLAFTGIK